MLLAGRAPFWSDITYLNHPWRVLPAEAAQRGVLPLWNPYAYLGMPLAADVQAAVWYPGSLLFHLFGFASALPVFLGLHMALAGLFSFLWLRRLRLTRYACLGAGLAFSLSGWTMSHLPFPNHIATVAFFPALLLFWDRPLVLALCLTAGFLSGYPPMLAGEAAAAWLAAGLLGSADRPAGRTVWSFWAAHGARWAGAGLLSMALSALLLIPAAELARHSDRGGGVDPAVALSFSFELKDLRQFLSPLLIPAADFDPLGSWWKTTYWGLGACAAAGFALARLPAAAAAVAVAYLAGAAFLLLGGTNPVSRTLWTSLWPLQYLRYPGNMAYLAVPALLFLVARGLHGLRGARLWAAFIGVELLIAGWGLQPTVPGSYFTDAGPLVRTLRRELAGHRYLLSPRALQWTRGKGPDLETASFDLKHRLYGMSNVPYHLPSASNLGNPLVPARSYAFMDHLFSRAGLADAAPWLGWADIGIVLTRERLPSGGLAYLGDSLWHLYANRGPASRAFWFDERAGERIPSGVGPSAPDLKPGVPVELQRPREDRFTVSGDRPGPGWAFIAEPLWPGWKASGGEGKPEPALEAFQKLRVPAGRWTLRFRYDPMSWRLGLALSVLSLCALAAYGGLSSAFFRDSEKGP